MVAPVHDRLAKALTVLLALPALLLPALCLLYILRKGVVGFDSAMLLGHHEAVAFDAVASLWPQIGGSLLLMLGASLLAMPVALGGAIYYTLAASKRQQRLLLTLMHLLMGVPPIVYGLCGLIVLVHLLHWGVSLAAGMVILAVIMLPMMVMNHINALARISIDRSEAARSLGLTQAAVIRRVWLPLAWPALLTGLLLGMARALSETAPILFTATIFSGVQWPESLFSPVPTLQTHLFYLAQAGASAASVDQAWAAALVLVLLVALFSMAALVLRRMGR